MKIAYTISGIYNSGGMENILIQKANYLADKYNYDVTIITTDQRDKKPFFPISENVTLINLNINYILFKNSPIWHIKKIILQSKHRKILTDLLSKERFDVVISLMDLDFHFLYKINDQSKKVLEYHFSKYSKINNTQGKLKKWLQKIRINKWNKIISKYDRFIVLTEEDKQQWGKLSNMQVIPNFIQQIPSQIAKRSSKQVISIGRISFQKGFDMLVKAWKLVHDSHPDWSLKIIGGGSKTELQNLIDESNLSDSVKLLPPTSDIDTEYEVSELYVLSSRYEGLPLVLLEAMSFGLPIVSFGCPCGPKDILRPSFGTIVTPGDIDGLASAIIRWIENPTLRNEATFYAQSEAENYIIDSIMPLWDILFHELKHDC